MYRTRTGRYHALATGRPGEAWQLGNWPTAREAAIAVDRATLFFGRDDLPLNLPRVSRRLGALSPRKLAEEAHHARKQKSASSHYFGVYQAKTSRFWGAYAFIWPDGGGRRKKVHLGHFEQERDAAVAHDRFVLGTRGPEARLNFPDARRKPATRDELLAWARRLKHEPKAGRYEGVSLKDTNTTLPWLAHLWFESRSLYLGAWRTPKEAATAYDRAALYYYGDDTFLNFPKTRQDLVPASAERLRAEAHRKRKKKTSSRYIGVWWQTQKRCWVAVVAGANEHRYVGGFADEKEAAVERDKEAIRILGDQAKLNFHPRTGEEVFGLRIRDLDAEGAIRLRGRAGGAAARKTSTRHGAGSSSSRPKAKRGHTGTKK